MSLSEISCEEALVGRLYVDVVRGGTLDSSVADSLASMTATDIRLKGREAAIGVV